MAKRGRPKKVKPEIRIETVETVTKLPIEERLAGCGRQEVEHIVYVGELVEKVLNSEFGAVLKALTTGRISYELTLNRESTVSPDRILGRLEMADLLWKDLEQYVIDKDAVQRPIISQPETPSYTATEPQPKQVSVTEYTFTA